jgi:hypothetical protein
MWTSGGSTTGAQGLPPSAYAAGMRPVPAPTAPVSIGQEATASASVHDFLNTHNTTAKAMARLATHPLGKLQAALKMLEESGKIDLATRTMDDYLRKAIAARGQGDFRNSAFPRRP